MSAVIGDLIIRAAIDAAAVEKGSMRARLAIGALKTAAVAGAGAVTGLGVAPALSMMRLGMTAGTAAAAVAKLGVTPAGALRTLGAAASFAGKACAAIGPGAVLTLASLAPAIVRVTKTLLALGAAATAAGLAIGVKLAADFEQLTVSFETMLRSRASAQSLLADLSKFAATTPLQFGEISQAARNLVAFGVAQDQVIPSLRVLGDLASGIGMSLDELTEIYGKARVQGRLFAQDINQFQGRGIPITQALAKEMGVTTAQVRALVETGKVGFPELQRALAALTAEGGQFSGIMEKQSHTIAGMWSTILDNTGLALRSFGETAVELFAVRDVLAELVRLTESLASAAETASRVLGALNRFSGAALLKKAAVQSVLPAVLSPLTNSPTGLSMRVAATSFNWARDRLGLGAAAGAQSAYEIEQAEADTTAQRAAAFAARWKGKSSIAAGARFDDLLSDTQKYRHAQRALQLDFATGAINAVELVGGLARLKQEYRANNEAARAMRATQQRANQMFEHTLTPLDQYKRTVSEATLLLAKNTLSWGQYARVLTHAKHQMDAAYQSHAQLTEDFRDGGVASAMDAIGRGQHVFDEMRTPAEKLKEEVRGLYDLFQAGAIDQNTLNRALGAAEKNLLGGIGAQSPGAMQAGSREAYSAFLQAQNRERASGEARRLFEEIKRQVEAQRNNTRALDENSRLLRDRFRVVEEQIA